MSVSTGRQRCPFTHMVVEHLAELLLSGYQLERSRHNQQNRHSFYWHVQLIMFLESPLLVLIYVLLVTPAAPAPLPPPDAHLHTLESTGSHFCCAPSPFMAAPPSARFVLRLQVLTGHFAAACSKTWTLARRLPYGPTIAISSSFDLGSLQMLT